MKLFIVESPGKVKKIQSMLGNGWTVESSAGQPAKGLVETKRYIYRILWSEEDQECGAVRRISQSLIMADKIAGRDIAGHRQSCEGYCNSLTVIRRKKSALSGLSVY